ncbi:MAG: hypothetical protein ACK46Q_03745 [Hyphomonas sp.]
MKPNTKHFKLNVPADLLDTLKQIAMRESRSVTAQINLMLMKQAQAEGAAQE